MQKLVELSSSLQASPQMPVLFVGHGNPMNAILDNTFTREWHRVGSMLPHAQAIVVLSAHWFTQGTHITDAPKQPLIYDMYGFPDELYQVKYEAEGDPELARKLQRALIKYEAQLDSTWGLDHGTWSVLKHLAPKPEVPILQISFDQNQSITQMIELFSSLKPLRQKGVVFIGSGNIVHNLRAVDFTNQHTFDWAIEFDAVAADAMQKHDLKALADPSRMTSAARLAVPTDDHYRPMLAAMSLLDSHETLQYFNEAIDLGSVGMRSFISSAS